MRNTASLNDGQLFHNAHAKWCVTWCQWCMFPLVTGMLTTSRRNTPETTCSLSPGTCAQCWHSRQKRLRIPVTLSPVVDTVGVVSVRNEREDKMLSIEQLSASVLMRYVVTFANKALHKTLSARCSFRIIARPQRLGACVGCVLPLRARMCL